MSDFSLKIDWLSFTFQATEEDKATFSDMWKAFLHYFPVFDEVMEDCVVFCGSGSRYFDNCVAWNDNILICWDNLETEYSPALNGVDSWQHGINVCIPSHGLHNIWYFLGLEKPDKEDFFYEYKDIYKILLDRHCRISRLDLALDDFTRIFTPSNYLDAWREFRVCSPCKRFSFCQAGKLGGETFYLGGRSNKLLRIYDKEKESRGKIKSIRYEIELHNRYANDVSDMILNDNFDFIQYFQKYFIKLKTKSDKWNGDKSVARLLPDDEKFVEWCNKCRFSEQKIVFPKTPVNKDFEKTLHWLMHGGPMSKLNVAIDLLGYDWFFNTMHTIRLREIDKLAINNTLRIRSLTGDDYKVGLARSDIAQMVFDDIKRCNIL